MSEKSTDKTVGGPSSISALVKIGTEWTQFSRGEQESNKRLLEIAQGLLPSYGNNWNALSVLTLRRQSISRILYYDDLYKKILDVPGVICEFGVQWGTTLAQLMAFRGVYEPYNHSRKIYGFDTFEGFSVIDEKDHGFSQLGDYSVNLGHIALLEEILTIHESYSPLSHIKKFDLIKGDASLTVGPWLAENPHAIISMAIFDMDVYKPTRDVLELILPRLTKGSLLVFDELNAETFPGETRAVDEVLGLNNIRLRRNSNQPCCAWAVFGE
jgi:hypothetical protein